MCSIFVLCFQHILYHSDKSEMPHNINYLWITKFDVKHYTLHMWNSQKNLVREYRVLGSDILSPLFVCHLHFAWFSANSPQHGHFPCIAITYFNDRQYTQKHLSNVQNAASSLKTSPDFW